MKKNFPKIDDSLIADLSTALIELDGWGSVELYVQNGKITQITKRAIKKTNHTIGVLTTGEI